jgi:hypothetical protein
MFLPWSHNLVVPKKISGRGVPTAMAVPYPSGYWYLEINAIVQ